MIRRDVRLDDRKVVFLFNPKTGEIWLRLLAPLEGRPTFATPAIAVTFKDLQRFEKECLHIHNREMCQFPPSIEAKPIRIYADRPMHVIVKLRDRKFAEGPLDVMEFAVRQIMTHWWKWERNSRIEQ